MNSYPDDYVVHNLPLVLLSGLGIDEGDDHATGARTQTYLGEGGFRINSNFPPVKGSSAQLLKVALLEQDSSNAPWRAQPSTSNQQQIAFRVSCVGRSHTLPPRKAPPPPHSPRLRPTDDNGTAPPPLVLHSTLSPLTPSSPLYPDGLMTPLWITKHQSRLPSAFVSFFSLTADPNTSSLPDNQIKAEINSTRSILNSTNYKTKLVVVLIGDGNVHPRELDDRLNNIRRSTNSDTRSLHFVPDAASSVEISEFVATFMTGLYPVCIEYYRELSKHARRKRNRSTVPPPTVSPTAGTSQVLPFSGWNVRYEFKLGVLAEFRQEMEAACRNYETAYESLLGPEVFEAIPAWSPRFNETRLLSDVIVLRILRCLLWSSQTSTAVKWWTLHRNRIQDLLGRRSVGTDNYGWEAWQSLWSRAMAELISRANVMPGDITKGLPPGFFAAYIASENKAPGERLSPWENLHHQGYWLNSSCQHVQARRDQALKMPEEDRIPPGQSPASVIASKAHLYDTYLSLEPYREFPADGRPGFDHSKEILSTIDTAIRYFTTGGQSRMADGLKLQKAFEYLQAKAWTEAAAILRPMWLDSSWRAAGWWFLTAPLHDALLRYATEKGDVELRLSLSWDLPVPTSLTSPSTLSRTDRISSSSEKELDVTLSSEHSLSRISSSFAFASAEGHVGEPVQAQLSLTHHEEASPVSFNISEIKVVFDGGIAPLVLSSATLEADVPTSGSVLADVTVAESVGKKLPGKRVSLGAVPHWTGTADLGLASGQNKIFQLQVTPRDAGDALVASITIVAESDGNFLTRTITSPGHASAYWWETRRSLPVRRRFGKDRDVSSINVLPKPPKVDLEIVDLKKAYYTDEVVKLTVRTTNNEESQVTAVMHARLLSPAPTDTTIRWSHPSDNSALGVRDELNETIQILPPIDLGSLSAGSEGMQSLEIRGTSDAIDHELELTVLYSLDQEGQSTLTKHLALDVPILRPFEANYLFHPRHHREMWPSFFEVQEDAVGDDDGDGDNDGNDEDQRRPKSSGLKQQYLITAAIASFAPEPLIIRSLRLHNRKTVGDAQCQMSPGRLKHTDSIRRRSTPREDEIGQTEMQVRIDSEQMTYFVFDLVVHKDVLGDRKPVASDFLMEIHWQREGQPTQIQRPTSQPVASVDNAVVLALPRFLASSEPRVLLRAIRDSPLLMSSATTAVAAPGGRTSTPATSSAGMATVSGPTGHGSVTEAIPVRLTYTIENPSMHFLTFNVSMEAGEDFAFSGPKSRAVSLVPISRCEVVYRILPHGANLNGTTTSTNTIGSGSNRTDSPVQHKDKEKGKDGKTWVRVRLDVLDAYFGQTLKIQPASEGVKTDAQGNILVRVD